MTNLTERHLENLSDGRYCRSHHENARQWHGESPVDILREAQRIVRPGGKVAVIHWRTDIATPRAPAADIRPAPEQILKWATSAGNLVAEREVFLLPPWHYGIDLERIATE